MKKIVLVGFVLSLVIAGILVKRQSPTPTPTPTPSPTLMATTSPLAPTMQINSQKTYTALMVTSAGSMNIELFAVETPQTVNNFVVLSRQNFYNDTKFHRIIKDFMIQGGDPKGDGTGGPGYKFADEPITRDYTRGIVAMANSGKNTNGSQFFIMTKDAPLPKNYVIFGQLVGPESLITLDKIANTPVTSNISGELSQPTQTVTITSITITEQ